MDSVYEQRFSNRTAKLLLKRISLIVLLNPFSFPIHVSKPLLLPYRGITLVLMGVQVTSGWATRINATTK